MPRFATVLGDSFSSWRAYPLDGNRRLATGWRAETVALGTGAPGAHIGVGGAYLARAVVVLHRTGSRRSAAWILDTDLTPGRYGAGMLEQLVDGKGGDRTKGAGG